MFSYNDILIMILAHLICCALLQLRPSTLNTSAYGRCAVPERLFLLTGYTDPASSPLDFFEKPQHYLPVLVDIDIKVKEDEEDSIDELQIDIR